MMNSSVQSWWTNPSSSRHQWCYIGVCNPEVCSPSEDFIFYFLKLREASSACMTGARCKIAILSDLYTLLKWSGCKEQSKQRECWVWGGDMPPIDWVQLAKSHTSMYQHASHPSTSRLSDPSTSWFHLLVTGKKLPNKTWNTKVKV
jgi:hypothetical protein